MYKSIVIITLACLVGAMGIPLTEIRLENRLIDTEHVVCDSNFDAIDECGLQQGFSHRFKEFAYPTNQTFLTSSCRRQADAFKCLKAYSKCLQPMPKQVLLAMVKSREKYNKRICSEKKSDTITKLLEFNSCMGNNKVTLDKGIQAELNSIATAEAIVNSKMSSLKDRLKHSCCSVAKAKRDFLDATKPNCQAYEQVAAEMIDSYLADTVGIICPNFDEKSKQECEGLAKLAAPKSLNYRSFVRPIINVIQTLA